MKPVWGEYDRYCVSQRKRLRHREQVICLRWYSREMRGGGWPVTHTLPLPPETLQLWHSSLQNWVFWELASVDKHAKGGGDHFLDPVIISPESRFEIKCITCLLDARGPAILNAVFCFSLIRFCLDKRSSSLILEIAPACRFPDGIVQSTSGWRGT